MNLTVVLNFGSAMDDPKKGLCFFRLNDIISVLENNTSLFSVAVMTSNHTLYANETKGIY